jgi:DNA-cytosine methyltransferase
MQKLIKVLSMSDGVCQTPEGRSRKMAIQGPVDFVDFFSGCGGMSSGFHKVGLETGYFRWMGAFDIDEHANKTYAKNFGHKPVALDLSGDFIPQVKSILLKNGHRRTTPLIVIGSAPCQGFSSHKKKDKRIDARNSLVSKFAEIATSLKPHFIIMENVPDLLARKHFHHFARFHEVLKKAGYRISADIINMAEFGVPQERHRAVIIASRIYDPLLPLPLVKRPNFKTVRQAIAHLPILSPQGGADAIDLMHRTSNHRRQTIEIRHPHIEAFCGFWRTRIRLAEPLRFHRRRIQADHIDAVGWLLGPQAEPLLPSADKCPRAARATDNVYISFLHPEDRVLEKRPADLQSLIDRQPPNRKSRLLVSPICVFASLRETSAALSPPRQKAISYRS